jgi:hypothetical protein
VLDAVNQAAMREAIGLAHPMDAGSIVVDGQDDLDREVACHYPEFGET